MKSTIAIIGMSALFPEADNLETFWQKLIDKQDLTSISNEEDFGADPKFFHDPYKSKPDKCYSLRGGYIRNFRFQPEGYRLEADFLTDLDAIYQWTLQTARQALTDSGYWQKNLEKAGIVLGNLSFPLRSSHALFSEVYAQSLGNVLSELLGEKIALPVTKMQKKSFQAWWSSSPAGITAKALGLGAAHFSLDAACASSLYAVKLACDQLQSHQADLMLAGAVSCADPLFIHMGFSIFQAYSADTEQSCPLDKRSAGLVSSEGAGMLVLKRYEDALRDNDHIYGTIAGVGLSNDGRGKFLLSPNPKGQIMAFERAYQDSNVSPEKIQYLECHATGTPLGDITEVNSIEQFFKNPPKIGSVKSNMGHLLTAAGMSGIMKVLLSMKNQLIPPTINVEQAIRSKNGQISEKNIVTENTPWHDAHKVACIDSFGFGGTNAHLILENKPENPVPSNPKNQKTPMAIIGMEIHAGSCQNITDFYECIYHTQQHFEQLPKNRWKGFEAQSKILEQFGLKNIPKGAYISNFELDLLRFRIQPNEAEKLEPQQTLMLKVADRAIQNAGFDLKKNNQNIAVIIAMETELAVHRYVGRWDITWQIETALQEAGIELSKEQLVELEKMSKDLLYENSGENSASQHTSFIGNIMTARISSLWDFTGASFTISAGENSVFRAIEVAKSLLEQNEADAVVVGAVDLSGGFESVITHNLRHQIADEVSLSFDEKQNGWAIGEGAGAIVLKKLEKAQADQNQIIAVIEDLQIVQDLEPIDDQKANFWTNAALIRENIQSILAKNQLQMSDIGYLEASANGIQKADESEMKALLSFENAKPTTALGSVKANLGHTKAAAGMLSILKTALCLQHNFVAGVPNFSKLKNAELFQKTGFYVPTDGRLWSENQKALVHSLGSDATSAVVLLGK